MTINKPLFAVTIRHQTRVLGGPRDGGQYDLANACHRCGSGAVRLDPLRLSGGALPPGRACLTLDFEHLVPIEVAGLLIGPHSSVVRPVLTKEGARTRHVQLVAAGTLPPLLESSEGLEHSRDACPVCGRDGYFRRPKTELLLRFPDVDVALIERGLLETFEWFGLGRLREPFTDSVLAAPKLLASGPIARTLAGIPGIELSQVSYGGSL